MNNAKKPATKEFRQAFKRALLDVHPEWKGRLYVGKYKVSLKDVGSIWHARLSWDWFYDVLNDFEEWIGGPHSAVVLDRKFEKDIEMESLKLSRQIDREFRRMHLRAEYEKRFPREPRVVPFDVFRDRAEQFGLNRFT